MRKTQDVLKVGLAVGAGTGPELADVFQHTLLSLAKTHDVEVAVQASARRYETYFSMARNGMTAAAVAKLAREDSIAYEKFLLELSRHRCRAVFRTAFNAESLYLVREKLRCVKIETLPLPNGELLLIRDEAQGFYGGRNNSPSSSPDIVSRVCEFRKETTYQILDFALKSAAERWKGPRKIDRIVAVYKFHLLDSRFARWISDYAKRKKLQIDLFQPDTMNRNLLRGNFSGNVLALGSNEWVDIMHADLLMKYSGLTQEEQCSRNVYLASAVKGMVEYQTVHGSADDIAGKGIVNPLATMRAAAAILENHGDRSHVRERLENAIGTALKRPTEAGLEQPQSTLAVMQQVLKEYGGTELSFAASFRSAA